MLPMSAICLLVKLEIRRGKHDLDVMPPGFGVIKALLRGNV